MPPKSNAPDDNRMVRRRRPSIGIIGIHLGTAVHQTHQRLFADAAIATRARSRSATCARLKARLPRFSIAGYPQHVIQRGNNRTALFATAADHDVFRWWLIRACARHGCQVHAYVLMTNHVHLLITPRDAWGISRAIQSVGRRYVAYFNAAYQRTGTLFEGRFRAAPVDTEGYLLTCYRYIELNPVRAGLVDDPADYPWSSHRANTLDEIDALVTPHERYFALGANPRLRRTAYRYLFANALDDCLLHEIREATNKRWALGSDRFRREIATLVARRAQPLPRGGERAGCGRPRRSV